MFGLCVLYRDIMDEAVPAVHVSVLEAHLQSSRCTIAQVSYNLTEVSAAAYTQGTNCSQTAPWKSM